MTADTERDKVKEIIASVRRVELTTQRFVDSVFSGAYKSIFKGRGIEFSEVREYQVGDDVRIIDWNVTARMGEPYVKEFIEERDLSVIVVFDVSASFEFGTQNKIKREVAAEIAATLSFSALRNNDRVGLVLFTDRIEKYIPPRKGRQNTLKIIREMLYFKQSGKKTLMKECLTRLSRSLKIRSVIFILSDFDEEPESYVQELRILRKRHDMVFVGISDLREVSFPDVGLIELEDAESGEQVLVDSSDPGFREAFSRLSEAKVALTEDFFRRMGFDFVRITSDEDWIKPLLRFAKMRERRMIR